MSVAAQSELPLLGRVVVSLRAGLAIALANIICVVILSWAWVHSHPLEIKGLSVTGSAKQAIRADLIVWKANVTASGPKLEDAYAALQGANAKTTAYLKQAGIPDSEVVASAITTAKHFAKDKDNNETDKISSWDLSQSFQVSGSDVGRIADVANRATSLIKDGVLLQSEAPKYLYTKMADLKIEMLAEATQDATARARQIAEHSGGKLGDVIDAEMGVMQINALYENDTSGEGMNDTTSLDKEVTAIVRARFSLK